MSFFPLFPEFHTMTSVCALYSWIKRFHSALVSLGCCWPLWFCQKILSLKDVVQTVDQDSRCGSITFTLLNLSYFSSQYSWSEDPHWQAKAWQGLSYGVPQGSVLGPVLFSFIAYCRAFKFVVWIYLFIFMCTTHSCICQSHRWSHQTN